MGKLTSGQRVALLENPNVLKITDKHVVFKPEFKITAAKLSMEGYPPEQIFRDHGIDPCFFKPKYCKHILRKWRAKLQHIGAASLAIENRGRKCNAPSEDILDEMDLEDLKSIIRIQQDIIEQVKKRAALTKKK